MGDLRLFADTMHALIAAENRVRQIEANAARHFEECSEIRRQHLPRGDRPAPSFFEATGAMNATRIVLEGPRP